MIILPRKANRSPARERRESRDAARAAHPEAAAPAQEASKRREADANAPTTAAPTADRDVTRASGVLRAAAWAVRLSVGTPAPKAGNRASHHANRDAALLRHALRGAAWGVRLSGGVPTPAAGDTTPSAAEEPPARNANRDSARERRVATRLGRPAAVLPGSPANGPMREARAGR